MNQALGNVSITVTKSNKSSLQEWSSRPTCKNSRHCYVCLDLPGLAPLALVFSQVRDS